MPAGRPSELKIYLTLHPVVPPTLHGEQFLKSSNWPLLQDEEPIYNIGNKTLSSACKQKRGTHFSGANHHQGEGNLSFPARQLTS